MITDLFVRLSLMQTLGIHSIGNRLSTLETVVREIARTICLWVVIAWA